MKTGVIGLGAMGVGMAANLARAGLLSCVWNRTRSKAESLSTELGTTLADSPADVAAQSELIIICVSRDEDVLEMVRAILPSLNAGSIVVDTSTVSVSTAETAAALLAEKECGFLDCPVSGGVEGARKGTLAMMVGGDEETLEQARDTLNAIAANIVLMGPVGSGQATKAVNQIMAAGINQAVTDALSFGQAMGLDMEKVIDVVGSGAAANWFLSHRGPTMCQGTFAPGFKLNLHHKDLSICSEMAKSTGQKHLPMVEMTLQDYEKLMQDGHGDEDISALYRLKRP